MSVSVEDAGGTGQDFDLNIAPIIDCFTVLIAYLLISASFLSIGFFDVGVSTTSEVSAPTQQQTPQEFMSVELGEGNSLAVKMRGRETLTEAIPAKAGARDYEGLLGTVRRMKTKWPEMGEASVSAASGVEYREVVQAIEALKKEMPKVFVGE